MKKWVLVSVFLICGFLLQAQPSLIPLPQKLEWRKGSFRLDKCRSISIKNPALKKEALLLQAALKKIGYDIPLQDEEKKKAAKGIVLQSGKVASPMLKEEAYQLDVNNKEVMLIANTPHGIFNGLQTLLQLVKNGVTMDACTITDWPAFAWRGYMVDVGRNYMSMDLLKQQIDVMARYKLNVFHFHPTEDVAWRIASKQYPQLTAPENMLRNKGLYYSEAEIKELINYCKERYITFVPEIDMPGHSAAFKRAMKTDMQSDSGLLIVKNILKEFCQTYDVPYIHIGADEVKITNQNFIPEVSAYIQSFGKKIDWLAAGWKFYSQHHSTIMERRWKNNERSIPFPESRLKAFVH